MNTLRMIQQASLQENLYYITTKKIRIMDSQKSVNNLVVGKLMNINFIIKIIFFTFICFGKNTLGRTQIQDLLVVRQNS